MARITVGHRPDLTPDMLRGVLEHHFGDKYDVAKARMPMFHFWVKQSAWKAVGIRLTQRRKKTIVAYSRLPGSASIRAVMLLVALAGAVGYFAVLSGFAGGVATSAYAGAIGFLVLMLWFLLVLWLPTLPGRGLEKEVKTFIRNAEELKGRGTP